MNKKHRRPWLRSGIGLGLGLGFLVGSFSFPALASPPVHLYETAPFALQLVKARWQAERAGQLVFTVERVFAGPAVDQIEVSTARWREAWGRPAQGYTGFFVSSDNPSVDIVFQVRGEPTQGQQVQVFFRGTTVFHDPPPEWLPLEEAEARLALLARERATLEVSLRAEPATGGDTVSYDTVFRNTADHPIFVNLDATYRFDLRDPETGRRQRQSPQVANPWDCEVDIRQLLPGEEVARPVPAAVLADLLAPSDLLAALEPGRYQVHLQYRSEGGCRRAAESAPPDEPPVWAGRKDAALEIGPLPAPGD